VPLGAIEAPPQLLVWLKSVGLAPLLPIAITLRLPKASIVTTTGSVLVEPTDVAGKLSEVAESETADGLDPVPLRLIDWRDCCRHCR